MTTPSTSVWPTTTAPSPTTRASAGEVIDKMKNKTEENYRKKKNFSFRFREIDFIYVQNVKKSNFYETKSQGTIVDFVKKLICCW